MAKFPNYYKVCVDRLTVKLEPIYEEVVEVVRCKDCKWWGYVVGCGHYCRCNANQMADTVEDDFCSYGERKEA